MSAGISRTDWGRWWGPVFEAERVTRSRRWQGYTLRSLFVLALLTGILLVARSYSGRQGTVTVRTMAELGSSLAAILNVLELVTVLAIAPAATAGAICLDRTGGSLAHLFTTDLSDREIVLGKLAARLVPVLVLLAASFPVAALATWLGGIDPVDLLSSSLIIGGLAILGSTLALMLSVWGNKPQEVLSVVFGIWATWMLALPVYWIVVDGPSAPEWLEWSNPFFLAMGHVNRPRAGFTIPSVIFGAVCLLLGGIFTTIAVRKVRVVACRSPRERSTRVRRRWPTWERFRAWRWERRLRWRREPNLDANPILWREGRRSRGSHWSRWIWGGFRTISTVCGVFLIVQALTNFPRSGPNEAPGLLLAALVVLGFLLIGAAVPAVLSDERVQGSLDVLLCAPVSSRSILWAKWRGAFRMVPSLAGWPLVIGLLYLFYPIGWSGRGIVLLVPAAIVAQGAALVSLGLFLATVLRRTAVATAWTIGFLLFAVVAFPIIGAYSQPPMFGSLDNFADAFRQWGVAEGSPFYTTGLSLSVALSVNGGPDDLAILVLVILWTAIYAVLAAILFELTVRVFDRCLGRMPERSASSELRPITPSETRVGELLEREVDRLAVP